VAIVFTADKSGVCWLTRNFLGKMAGLVDYGVDSDRESNDSPNHENSSVSIFIINIAIM
jgi:hypothetical protein